jgi:CRISPR-associated exonuclease Cas4
MSFLKFIEEGLKNADSGLGDRSQYVGASDVGQCLKKSYLQKTKGSDYSLKQLIIFQRGHNAEEIVKKGLQYNPSGLKFHEQVETAGKGELSFMKSHLDFVVNFPNELVPIECKSISSPLPNGRPRESWLFQVALQMSQLRLTAKKKVERAFIVTVDVNTGEMEEHVLGYSEPHAKIAEARAKKLWNAVQNKEEPEGEISDLCGFCPFKMECNTLQKNADKLPSEIVAMAKRAKELSAASKEAKALRENILAFMQAANIRKGSGEDITLSVQNSKGRKKVSIDKLKQHFPEVADKVIEDGDPFSSLRIY